MSEFSGRGDFDLRRVVTEVDFQTRRRGDESSSECADPDEDSLGARSLLGQFTAGSLATADPAHQGGHAVHSGAATMHDIDGAEIRWRDAPPEVSDTPSGREIRPVDSTPPPPVPTGTATPDVEPLTSLGWRDAAEPSTDTESSRHDVAPRNSRSRDQLLVAGSAAVGVRRAALARLSKMVAPAVAVAILVAIVLVASGDSGAVRHPAATATKVNAVQPTAEGPPRQIDEDPSPETPVTARHRGDLRLHSRWRPGGPQPASRPSADRPRHRASGIHRAWLLIPIGVLATMVGVALVLTRGTSSGAQLPATPRQWVNAWAAAAVDNPGRVCHTPVLARARRCLPAGDGPNLPGLLRQHR